MGGPLPADENPLGGCGDAIVTRLFQCGDWPPRGKAHKKSGGPWPAAFLHSSARCSGGWSDVVAALHFARLANAATRPRRFRVVVDRSHHPDRGGQDADGNALVRFRCHRDGSRPFAARTLAAFRAVAALLLSVGTFVAFGALGTLGAFGALVTLGTVLPIAPLRTLAAFAANRLRTLVLAILVVIIIVGIGRDGVGAFILVVFVTATPLVLFLEARPAVLEDPEIMVGELEIIFGLDAVPGKLRVPRKRLIFLQQLGRIAALAIVLAIAIGPIGHARGSLSTTTATAAGLTIIDQ